MKTNTDVICFCCCICWHRLSSADISRICNSGTDLYLEIAHLYGDVPVETLESIVTYLCKLTKATTPPEKLYESMVTLFLAETGRDFIDKMFQLLPLVGLLPLPCYLYVSITSRPHAMKCIDVLYGEHNDSKGTEYYNRRFNELFDHLVSSDISLKGFSKCLLASILDKLYDIIETQEIRTDDDIMNSLNNENVGLREHFGNFLQVYFDYHDTIIHHNQSKKPCNIFYTLNNRLMMRDSISKKKVYVEIDYSTDGMANVVGMNKSKSVRTNKKFIDVFYNNSQTKS